MTGDRTVGTRVRVPDGYVRSVELAKRCGISHRMLCWWIDRRWIVPTVMAEGSGYSTMFSEADADRAARVLDRYRRLKEDLDSFTERASRGEIWEEER